MEDFGLYFITDRRLSKKNPVEDARSAVKAGVKIVQYREKEAPTKQMVKECMEINAICKRGNAIFLVNDGSDVALAVGADGVHLGQEDMPYEHARKILGSEKLIGLSAHSAEEALKNQQLGADYTSIGPIYHTATKKDAKASIGLEPIKELRNKQLKDKLKIPFIAIGGINESNIDDVLKAGAKNIAMISAIAAKEDVEGAVRGIIKILSKHETTNDKP